MILLIIILLIFFFYSLINDVKIYLNKKLLHSITMSQMGDNHLEVKSLLEIKANPNYYNKKTDNPFNDLGWTSLGIAARIGNIKITNLLLEHKANINQKDRMKSTALMHGLFNQEIVTLLLENKADVNAVNIFGETVFTLIKSIGTGSPNSPSVSKLLNAVKVNEEEQSDFKNIKKILYLSLFNKTPSRSNESLRKFYSLNNFDIKVVEHGILPFLRPESIKFR